MIKSLLQRLPSADELKEHKIIKRLGADAQHSPLWQMNHRSASNGMAAGVFMAFLPIPLRTIPLIFLCIWMKANFVIALACTWLLNFVVMGPIYYFAFQLGVLTLGWQDKYQDFVWDVNEMLGQLAWIWQPLLLGSAILGLLAALFSYYITRIVWYQRTMKRWHRRHQD